eukprot:TRINITY_DN5883_c0_g1_i2.p1 TRINITY_DN5883_c0_g1~~TRINITY_DN5883_c0_g1_i2.p1  ORF type:complete len:1062 (-),score=218.99 TRINITY_DN5883_c0_g1_i2:3-3188(-)
MQHHPMRCRIVIFGSSRCQIFSLPQKRSKGCPSLFLTFPKKKKKNIANPSKPINNTIIINSQSTYGEGMGGIELECHGIVCRDLSVGRVAASSDGVGGLWATLGAAAAACYAQCSTTINEHNNIAALSMNGNTRHSQNSILYSLWEGKTWDGGEKRSDARNATKISGSVKMNIINSDLRAHITAKGQHYDGIDSDVPTSLWLEDCLPSINASIKFSCDDSQFQKFLDEVTPSIEVMIKTIGATEICNQMANLLETNISSLVKGFSESYILPFYKEKESYHESDPKSSQDTIDLSQNTLFDALAFVVDDITGINGSLSWNTIANLVTFNTGSFSLDSIVKFLKFPSLSFLSGTIESLGVSGINTWTKAALFKVINTTQISNFASLSSFGVDVVAFFEGLIPFNIPIPYTSSINASYLKFEQSFATNIDLSNLALGSILNLLISKSSFDNLSREQFFSPGCQVSSVSGQSSFFDLSAQMKNLLLSFSLDSKNPSSSDPNLLSIMNGGVSWVSNVFAPHLNAIISTVLSGPLRDNINSLMGSFLSQSSCPNLSKYPDKSFGKIQTISAFCVAGFCYFALMFQLFFKQWRSNTKGYLSIQDEESELLLSSFGSESSVDLVNPINESSLLCNTRLPLRIRVAVPAAILILLALFFSSNMSYIAVVSMLIMPEGPDGKRIETPSLSHFILADTVRDMWKAGAIPLSLLVAIFSGAWPSVKLALMMSSWILPNKYLSTRRRESFIMFLDVMGKWSFIDLFMMPLLAVVLRFYVEMPKHNSSIVEQLILFVKVTPKWGFTSFLYATIFSLVLTHFLVIFHRRAMKQELSGDEEKISAFQMHASHFPSLNPSLLKFGFLFLVLITITMMVLGVAMPSFAFSIKGAAGLALEMIEKPTYTVYSVIDLAIHLPDYARGVEFIPLVSIQFLFTVTVIIVPLLHLLIIGVIWFVPLRVSTQRKVFKAAEILNSWSATDVLSVTFIASLAELRQFTRFLVGDKCNFINPVLERYFSPVLGGYTTCLDVITTLHFGCWILLAASVVNSFFSFFVMHSFREKINLRMKASPNTKLTS